MEFDEILFDRFLLLLNRAAKTSTPLWRRVAACRDGRVVVDVIGAEGHTRRWIGLVDGALTVLDRSELDGTPCPRMVVTREHLFEVSRSPWRFLANPALLRVDLPGFARRRRRVSVWSDEPTVKLHSPPVHLVEG